MKQCPYCHSDRFYETIHVEHCFVCGLHLDYTTGEFNDAYQCMLNAREAAAYQEEVEQSLAQNRENVSRCDHK